MLALSDCVSASTQKEVKSGQRIWFYPKSGHTNDGAVLGKTERKEDLKKMAEILHTISTSVTMVRKSEASSYHTGRA